MHYEKNQLNPLVVTILQVLKNRQTALGIHHLLQEIKSIAPLPDFDDDEQLALFKLNWLMMNALYQLQQALLGDGYYLQISTLEIMLSPLNKHGPQAQQQTLQHQPLRDYYLDWKNFSNTTIDEVQSMLEGVWQEYLNPGQQLAAYKTLGLEGGESWAQVKKAYRKLVVVHHPDKGGQASRFMEVRQAYECLKQALQG